MGRMSDDELKKLLGDMQGETQNITIVSAKVEDNERAIEQFKATLRTTRAGIIIAGLIGIAALIIPIILHFSLKDVESDLRLEIEKLRNEQMQNSKTILSMSDRLDSLQNQIKALDIKE